VLSRFFLPIKENQPNVRPHSGGQEGQMSFSLWSLVGQTSVSADREVPGVLCRLQP
jgi:hypothetical protein